MTQQSGIEKRTFALIAERRNWSNWLSDCENVAFIATQFFHMHTTACASERNWSKWGLMFTQNVASLLMQRAWQMHFLSENPVFADFSDAWFLDLSSEDND